jgi:hypothetical protein
LPFWERVAKEEESCGRVIVQKTLRFLWLEWANRIGTSLRERRMCRFLRRIDSQVTVKAWMVGEPGATAAGDGRRWTREERKRADVAEPADGGVGFRESRGDSSSVLDSGMACEGPVETSTKLSSSSSDTEFDSGPLEKSS